MPITITADRFAKAAARQTEAYTSEKPVDLINTERPMLKWFIEHKREAGGGLLFNEKIRFTNDGNFQMFSGADQVTYNTRDTVKLAGFPEASAHDGFYITEQELRENGIIITDSETESQMGNRSEFKRIIDVLRENQDALRESMQEGLDLECHLDGSQSPKSAVGLDGLVATDPTVGVIGGLDRAQFEWFRNQANVNISPANLIDEMEKTYRDQITYGGVAPTVMFCGGDFLDAYRTQAGLTINRQINGGGNERGGVSLDAGVTRTYFKGVELIWDPMMDKLDQILGVIPIPFSKRCYSLNPEGIKLRPTSGAWMIPRRPERPPDRYIHHFGLTASYRYTLRNPRSLAVFSVA